MDMLHRRCNGKHEHQCIEGLVRVGGRWANRSTRAQVYPKQLVEQFVRLVWSEKKQQHVHEVHEAREVSRKHEHEHDCCVGELGDDKSIKQAALHANIRRCHMNAHHVNGLFTC